MKRLLGIGITIMLALISQSVFESMTSVTDFSAALNAISLVQLNSSISFQTTTSLRTKIYYSQHLTNGVDLLTLIQWIVPLAIKKVIQGINPVKPTVIPKVNLSEMCNGFTSIFTTFDNDFSNTDLVLFVLQTDLIGIDQVVGTPCAISILDGRPIIGLLSLNLFTFASSFKETHHLFKSIIGALLSILGFSNLLFLSSNMSSYLINNSTVSGYSQFLKSPELSVKLITYFDCSSFDSIPVNNNRGTILPLQFSSLFLPFDIMSDMGMGYLFLTVFDYALLKDTLWYNVDYSFVESIDLGLKIGCKGLFSIKTPITPIFGSGQIICSPDHKSKQLASSLPNDTSKTMYGWSFRGGYCIYDRIPFQTVNFEKFGQSSRCLQVNGNAYQSAGCFEIGCGVNKVFIKINGLSYTCEVGIYEIKISDFSITCPQYSVICQSFEDQVCGFCSGNGVCTIEGKCLCDILYEGKKCDSKISLLSTDLSNILVPISYFVNSQIFDSGDKRIITLIFQLLIMFLIIN